MLVHTVWYGTFLLERKGESWEVIRFVEGPADAGELALELEAISGGELLDRERRLLEEGGITHTSDERTLSHIENGKLVPFIDIRVSPPGEMSLDMSLLTEANIIKARRETVSSMTDGNILSTVGALTDVDTSLNLMIERIREWYVKYWPEMDHHIEKESVLDGLMVSPHPDDLITFLEENDAKAHKKLRSTVPDQDIDRDSLIGLSIIAGSARSLMATRATLEGYLEGEMKQVAPNLTVVVGPLIGARLIHAGGGLKRLALLPASTVQVLGAEKAFFRFLKEGGKPPKHGVLFQHSWVHSAPRNIRGRIARTIASSAALAARLDAYGGTGGDEIRLKLEGRVEAVKERKKGPALNGGRQPPFREGWWANKTHDRKRQHRPQRRRHKR
ncbi:MAG: hypothetical protein KAH57_02865 [Thermoplasmata archaeon]|nr:hypothetical protein [Thermoplasmata archaeon]